MKSGSIDVKEKSERWLQEASEQWLQDGWFKSYAGIVQTHAPGQVDNVDGVMELSFGPKHRCRVSLVFQTAEDS